MAWAFLIIDHNDEDSAITAEQLKRLQPGCDVLTSRSGAAALALLEEQRLVPSLTFLDHSLPELNGIEFLGSLRHSRWLDGAPVAMLTGPANDRVVVTCYRLGAAAFLTKPVPLHELRETLRAFARPAKRMTAATVVPGRGATSAGTKSAA